MPTWRFFWLIFEFWKLMNKFVSTSVWISHPVLETLLSYSSTKTWSVSDIVLNSVSWTKSSKIDLPIGWSRPQEVKYFQSWSPTVGIECFWAYGHRRKLYFVYGFCQRLNDCHCWTSSPAFGGQRKKGQNSVTLRDHNPFKVVL